ncbi:substrate-binding domain-containing protein [Solwaraspora sp. WMMD406]|uniref:substrate-binding domain-containing protein n=1 Tax=Solwaraspora sp. WMMD406 TaxID=3016095 RepID=UPI002416B82A|nr:substrate-binding domain-containing protein [Solwaraspora sp. WMMD406]MDG4764072.1 substrate-binding domain-containing protein [Solwaraspora sp. WMMD406]
MRPSCHLGASPAAPPRPDHPSGDGETDDPSTIYYVTYVDARLCGRIVAAAGVCHNDLAALGLLDGLAAADVRVPTEISVVGYDDLSFARWLAPALTTARQPKYQLGRVAAELLLAEGGPDHAHREVRLRPSLVVRSSTARPWDGGRSPR